jgi:hypothetical protein
VRKIEVLLSFLVLLFLISPGPSIVAQAQDHSKEPWDFPEARQFDFWIGEWTVNNRFIQDNGSWQDGGRAHVKIFPILDGKAILEFWDGRFNDGSVLRGFSLRYFDKAKQKWQLALNWPSPNRPGFSELEGAFRHGRGQFFRTNDSGKITRYSFSDVSPTSLRWDNGVSTDGGNTWNGTWIMEFSRTAQEPSWSHENFQFHTYIDGTRCTGDESKEFDFLAGEWIGTISQRTSSEWKSYPASLRAFKVLDGCAIFNLTEYQLPENTIKVFEIRSYVPQQKTWVSLRLDNQPGTGFEYESGNFQAGTIELKQGAEDDERKRFSSTRWTEIHSEQVSYELSKSPDGKDWTVDSKVSLGRK